MEAQLVMEEQLGMEQLQDMEEVMEERWVRPLAIPSLLLVATIQQLPKPGEQLQQLEEEQLAMEEQLLVVAMEQQLVAVMEEQLVEVMEEQLLEPQHQLNLLHPLIWEVGLVLCPSNLGLEEDLVAAGVGEGG